MDFTNKIITKNAKETAEVGKVLAGSITPGIICLYGELGSGKTTFTQGFARGLGITSRLLSPTFIIVRRYQIPKKDSQLYHVDLYRLLTISEMEGIGLPEIFADQSAYTVVEWAERLGDLLPKKRIDIHLSTAQDDTHIINIEYFV
jgi:tRNA threonylcarbamoyladenosine biosynthesis protein TsaE